MPLFKISTLIYGGMTVVGASLTYFAHATLGGLFRIPPEPGEILRLVAIGLLSAAFLLMISQIFEVIFTSYQSFKKAVTEILGPTSVPMALYLAAVSSLGEELLFRGAIQPFAGLAITSLIFGLLHMGPDGAVSAWSIWAFLAGLLLGWTVDVTGSLWPALIAHFSVNATSILSVRRAHLRERAKGGAGRIEPPA